MLFGVPFYLALELGLQLNTLRIESTNVSTALFVQTQDHGECHIGVHNFNPNLHIFCEDGASLP